MNQVEAERFKKHIAYIKKLPPEQFNFAEVINECGTVGCIMGHTPKVFPDLVKYSFRPMLSSRKKKFFDVVSKDGRATDYLQVAEWLFGIPHEHVEAVFIPRNPYAKPLPPLSWLGRDATPKEAAENMELYLKHYHPQHV